MDYYGRRGNDGELYILLVPAVGNHDDNIEYGEYKMKLSETYGLEV